jgi:hypothetical protein
MAIHGSDKQKVRPSGKRDEKRKREKREKVERKRKN